MTIDQDPAVLRAQERARAKARTELAARARTLAGAAEALGNPLELDAAALVQLAADLRDLAAYAAVTERAAVLLAKDAGATWEQIGNALGMARQNAQAKYGARGREA
ncbi:hypothetical protein GCM10018962_77350 [Dactylosporangium matsuzakiense]|uniref:hypothetical protein n=1 Tax=Dactylosporangium matsuzakiense TaxID=53360 RepID=UPI0031F0F00C